MVENEEEMALRTVKVNSKGQVTIPKEIREREEIEPKDTVIVQDISGTITVNKPKKEAYDKLAEVLAERK